MATAPVLFAAEEHPVLRIMAARKFSKLGDTTEAFELVLQSEGLARQGPYSIYIENFHFVAKCH